MKSREGDLIESFGGLIFDVKGLIHPPDRTIAFIRYFPERKGERRRDKMTFDKVYSLSKRYALLKERFPQYLVYDSIFDETLCEVPECDVKRHYKPEKELQKLRGSEKLDSLVTKALQLAGLLKEKANVAWNALGISGSILVMLHREGSDVDLIVYGSKNCFRVHDALGCMLKDEYAPVKLYDQDDLKMLFDFRSKDTAMSFEDFVRTESRKVLQGKFMGTDYFMRFVKDWNEIRENYGDVQYKNLGNARIKATVADDSESIFTPCSYKINSVEVIEGPQFPVQEIASFRGRFCEHARTGEAVVAQGKVERVTDLRRNHEYCRLLIGNKPSDFMVLQR